jgi:mono/diheme cytochrome c family protein
MRLWKILLIVIIAIVVGVAGYAAGLIRRGFSALTPPSRLETVIARTMRRMAIPSAASKQRNPLAGSAETPNVIAAGRAHWADHCATCHGNDGSGLTQIGENLYPKAPDMRLPATQNLSDGELYYIIVNGVRLTGMPAWGQAGTGEANENWQLVSFIRHARGTGGNEGPESKDGGGPGGRTARTRVSERRRSAQAAFRRRAPSLTLKGETP